MFRTISPNRKRIISQKLDFCDYDDDIDYDDYDVFNKTINIGPKNLLNVSLTSPFLTARSSLPLSAFFALFYLPNNAQLNDLLICADCFFLDIWRDRFWRQFWWFMQMINDAFNRIIMFLLPLFYQQTFFVQINEKKNQTQFVSFLRLPLPICFIFVKLGTLWP